MDSTKRWIPCTIENSGFSSERRFEVELDNGNRVVGTAYLDYLRDASKQPISEDIPEYGSSIEGYVQCRVLRESDDSVWVEFPGTDVFHVPNTALSPQA